MTRLQTKCYKKLKKYKIGLGHCRTFAPLKVKNMLWGVRRVATSASLTMETSFPHPSGTSGSTKEENT